MDPLFAAIMRGDYERVVALVDSGVRIDGRNGHGEYPTAISIQKEDWQVLRYLLKSGAPVDEEYSLPAAIAMSQFERVRDFCRSGRANLVDHTGRTPLIYAVSARSLDVIELLLREGADPNRRDSDGNNILYRAAWQPDPRVFEILLRGHADPRCVNVRGQTPLLYLLSAPLILELSASHLECARLLLGAGVPIHHPGRRGVKSPLAYQCALQTLLGFYGFTDGRAHALDMLLEHGGEELIRLRGSQALITAVKRGYLRAVQRLLAAGVSPDARDEYGAAAIVLAVRHGDAAMIAALLDSGARVPAFDERGRLVARRARDAKDPRVAELLAPYDLPVRFPSTPGGLADAISAGDLAGVHQLLDAGINLNGELPGNDTPLCLAASLGHAAIVEALATRGADLDALSYGDGFGTTPVEAAIARSHFECVRILLSHGCNVTAGFGAHVLWLAAREGKNDVVRLLLEAGADPSLHVHPKKSPLLCAVLGGHFETGETLLAALQDPVKRRKEIEIALRGSMRSLEPRLPFFLLEQPPGICRDQEGRDFVLQTAAWAGNAEVLRHALASGQCTLNQETEEEATPLVQAVRSRRLDAVRILVEAGADVHLAEDRTGRTPLMIACGWCGGFSDPEIVRFLLESGARLDARDKDGQTSLMIAVERGQYDVVEMLLRFGPDLSPRDRQGRDARDLARVARRSSLIALLDQAAAVMVR